MPLFRTQVFYQFGATGKWSNVYHTLSDTIVTADANWQETGVVDLAPLLHPACILTSILTSDPASDDFITTPINLVGTSTATDGLLPLFNSAKVLIPIGLGKPDYKYLKGFLTEAITEATNINSGTITAIVGLFDALITDMEAAGSQLCSNTSQPWFTSTVQQAVQMRQMHRKRKKKVV